MVESQKLYSQQKKFIKRLKAQDTNFTTLQPEEFKVISGDKLLKIRDFCEKIKIYPYQQIFRGKLGEEAIYQILEDLILKYDLYEIKEGGDKGVDLRTNSNPEIRLQIKTRTGDLNSVIWYFSQIEIEQNDIFLCAWLPKVPNKFDEEIKVVFAGFLTKDLLRGDTIANSQGYSVRLENLLYAGKMV